MAALAQASIIIALIFGINHYPESSVLEILAVNGFFMMGWVVSGLLFRWAAEPEYELESKAVV